MGDVLSTPSSLNGNATELSLGILIYFPASERLSNSLFDKTFLVQSSHCSAANTNIGLECWSVFIFKEQKLCWWWFQSQVLTCTVVVHNGSFTGTRSLDCIPVLVQNVLSSLCLCTEPWAGIIWKDHKKQQDLPRCGANWKQIQKLKPTHLDSVFSQIKEVPMLCAAQIQMY